MAWTHILVTVALGVASAGKAPPGKTPPTNKPPPGKPPVVAPEVAKPPPTAPAPSAPGPAKPAPRRPDTPAPGADVKTQALLDKAKSTCDAFELDQCIAETNAVLSRSDLTSDQQVVAYAQLAAAYAVLGDIVEAEGPYRLLLRLRPQFDLPADTPPKILSVFRKVQVEEQRLRKALDDAKHLELVDSIKVRVEAPPKHKGGTPMRVAADVQDPNNGVKQLTLRYRMDPRSPFAAVPFKPADGRQVVDFTAAQTASDQPVKMQYYVVAEGVGGSMLVTNPSPDSPAEVAVEAGQPASPAFWQQKRFWAVAGVGGGAAACGALVFGALVMTTAVVGSGLAYLLLRGDGTPQTTLGSQEI